MCWGFWNDQNGFEVRRSIQLSYGRRTVIIPQNLRVSGEVRLTY